MSGILRRTISLRNTSSITLSNVGLQRGIASNLLSVRCASLKSQRTICAVAPTQLFRASFSSDVNTPETHSIPEIPKLEYIDYSSPVDVLAVLKERGFISATTSGLAKHLSSNVDIVQESLNEALKTSANGESVKLYADGEKAVVSPSNINRRAIYAGFDPTSDSLHLGNLLVIIALMHLHRAGHTVISLVGGATGMVGDPSGRSTERVLLDESAVTNNAKGIQATLAKFLTSDRSLVLPVNATHPGSSKISASSPVRVNNLDWYGPMSVVSFLRDIGKYFRVSAMLNKDSVKKRMEGEGDSDGTGMSFTEFSYQTLQGYDFHLLKQQHGCSIEIGGSDQWGNITAGIDYIHRVNVVQKQEITSKYQSIKENMISEFQKEQKLNNKNKGNKPAVHTPEFKAKLDAVDAEMQAETSSIDDEAHGLTLPLLTTSNGVKFGKSAGNAIWLQSDKTSAYVLYQYILQTTDQDVCKLLKLLTFLTNDCANAIFKAHMTFPEARIAQKVLAEEVVRLIHGDFGVTQAQVATQLLFSGKGTNASELHDIEMTNGKDTYMGLKIDELIDCLSGVPSVTTDKLSLITNYNNEDIKAEDIKALDVLTAVAASGICASKAEAKRLIAGGGLYFNNKRVEPSMVELPLSELILGKVVLIRSGQKKHHLLIVG